MKKPVIKMGTPSLFQPSKAITDFNTPALNTLIDDLYDTMKAYDGIGIAAPQIGVNQRIVLIEMLDNPRYPNRGTLPFTVLINPTITLKTDEQVDDWEGCLSVPGIRAKVPRFTKIDYTYQDANGNTHNASASDFHARVIQHECDHLDGILFPMRVKDFQHFGFEDALPAFNPPEETEREK